MLCFFCLQPEIRAQTSAFTYQGKLTDVSIPANGTYDFQFSLYDAGNMLLASGTIGGVTVTNGIFTVNLDFGATFFTSNAARFLEIGVKLPANGSYTTLTPRQPITSSPFAVKALSAASADSFTGVLGASQGGTGIGPGLPPADTYLRSNGAGWQLSGIQAADVPSNISVQAGGITGVLSASQGGTGIGPAPPPFGAFLRSDGTGWTLGGVSVSDIPAGSTNYVQNGTSTQAATNFNVSGMGTANTLNAVTQYNLGGNRILGNAGTQNFFAGINAGVNNAAGTQNSFVGNGAGATNTTGGFNAFFGTSAGFQSNGSDNSFFGNAAGQANTSGSDNSFFGLSSGFINNSGSANSFFGHAAGGANTTGGSNTMLGSFANVASGNLNYATAIGADSTVSTSNSVVLGRAADTVRIPGALKVQNPNGLVVSSPNGACWIITVSNAGAMSAVTVACP